MAFKTILIQLGESGQNDDRLFFAAEIARAYDAHLVGLYVVAGPQIPLYIGPGYIPAELLREEARRGREAAARVESAFRDRMANTDLSVEWRCYEGRAEDVISVNARYADLTIIGQPDPEDPRRAELTELPATVALSSGRPVLIAPSGVAARPPGREVIVAWNASREATRAITDALPFLQRADNVLVFSVNPRQGPDDHGDLVGADIAHHLARHGVNAKAAKVETDGDVADAILERAADTGCDLLVMGAYGRSRTRELILGGATYDMLRRTTIPVLLSH